MEIQGHRGARGHYPENTVSGFLAAVEMGVSALEMDLVVSGDGKLVVSHEAWMNEDICSLPGGAPVKKGTGRSFNIFKMAYEEVRSFDCGARGNPEFPLQKREAAYKPLFDEVVFEVESYIIKKKLRPVSYNIELKLEPEPGVFNPAISEFARLSVTDISKLLSLDRFNIQSFDTGLLNEVYKLNNRISIGLLVENQENIEYNLRRLNFKPAVYSPEFCLLDKQQVVYLHQKGIKVIPWTVNDEEDMEKLISYGVDGIITDYPDRLINLIAKGKKE